jgi:3-phosphoglycerate kinase
VFHEFFVVLGHKGPLRQELNDELIAFFPLFSITQVSSKIGVIDSLMQKCDKLIIGGGMVFTFLKARGLNVGSSLVEEDKIQLAKDLEAKAKAKGSVPLRSSPLFL